MNSFRVPRLEGETSAPFVRGVAEFTRLRVDRPGKELILNFHTNPTRFQATTGVRFRVVVPPANTSKTRLRFVLHGTVPSNSFTVQNSIRTGLGLALDVDVSRIQDVIYEVSLSLVSSFIHSCYRVVKYSRWIAKFELRTFLD